MAKPIKCLELHYPMIQFLTMKITLSVYNLVTQYFMLLCCCVRVNLVPPLRSWSRQTTWARQTSTMLQVFGLKTLQVHLFSSVFASCRTTMVFTRISLWYVSNNWVFHGGGDCRFTFAFYILHDSNSLHHSLLFCRQFRHPNFKLRISSFCAITPPWSNSRNN